MDESSEALPSKRGRSFLDRLRWLLRSLEADDVFISYSRSDGKPYLQGLDAALSKRGYSCFTDRYGTDASRLPPETLFRKIRLCKTLVLIGSPGALEKPEHLAPEVAAFAEENGTARIVCISFDADGDMADWSEAPWDRYAVGKAREREPTQALRTGEPTPAVVDAIASLSNYMKSKDRLRKYRNRALGAFLVLLAASVVAGSYAAYKTRESQRLAAISESRAIADRSKTQLRQHPEQLLASSRLSVAAMEKALSVRSHNVEADAALRENLRVLPRLLRSDTVGHGDDAERGAPKIDSSALSPDGHQLALLTDDHMLRVYETGAQPIKRGNPVRECDCDCREVSLSNDLRRAAAILSEGRGIRIFDLQAPTQESTDLPPEVSGEGIALSPDGRYLAVYSHEGEDIGRIGQVRIFALPGGREITAIRDLNMRIVSLAFGATGGLAVGGVTSMPEEGRFNGRVALWPPPASVDQELSAASFADPTVIEQAIEVTAVAPCSGLKSFATDRGLWRKSGASYEPIASFPDERSFPIVRDEIMHLACDDDRGTLTLIREIDTTQNENQFDEKTVEIWDTSGYAAISRIVQPASTIGVSFASSGNLVAAVSEHSAAEEETRIYPTTGGDRVKAFARELKGNGDWPDRFDSIDGFTVHVANSVAAVRDIWNGQSVTFSLANELETVKNAAISIGGKFIALSGSAPEGGDKVVVFRREGASFNLWKTVRPTEDELDAPFMMSLSADGRWFAGLYADGEVLRLKDLDRGRDVTPPSLETNDVVDLMVLSPAGRFIAIGRASGQVSVWDLSCWPKQEPVAILAGTRASSMGFSRDERYLGVGAHDGLLHVFETSGPDGISEIARLSHEGIVTAFAFSDDGKNIAAASSDRHPYGLEEETSHTLVVSALQAEDLLAEAKRRIGAIEDADPSRPPAERSSDGTEE